MKVRTANVLKILKIMDVIINVLNVKHFVIRNTIIMMFTPVKITEIKNNNFFYKMLQYKRREKKLSKNIKQVNLLNQKNVMKAVREEEELIIIILCVLRTKIV